MVQIDKDELVWQWRDVLIVISLWILFVAISSLLFFNIIKEKPYVGSLVCNVFILIVLVWLHRKKGVSWREFGFPKRGVRRDLVWGALVGFSLPMVVNLVQLRFLKIAASIGVNHFLYLLVLPFTLEGVSGIILSPLVEELFDRGILYRLIRRRTGVVASVLMISCIISLSHISSMSNLEFFFIRFFYNVVLCMIYERSGNMYRCISCHIAINYISAFYRVIDA